MEMSELEFNNELFDDPIFLELYETKTELTNSIIEEMTDAGLNSIRIDDLVTISREYERYLLAKQTEAVTKKSRHTTKDHEILAYPEQMEKTETVDITLTHAIPLNAEQI
jgi:hypothetical protein